MRFQRDLASIYLLEHLLDYLDLEQFERLVEFTRFAREENESRADYVVRCEILMESLILSIECNRT